MPRIAVAALLLVLAALAAWWWWPNPPAPPRVQRDAAAASPLGAVAADRTEPGAAAAAERELVGSAGAAIDHAVMVDVKVVDETTREPIPRADVCWADASAQDRVASLPPAERARFDDDDELMPREHGQRARTDERGVVRVPVSRDWTHVVARTTDCWGRLDVYRRDAGRVVLLTVGVDSEVAVRVVDSEGQPVADVPVRVAKWPAKPTDGSGFVVFRHLQHLAVPDRAGNWTPRDERVWLAIPGCEDVGATFALLSPPQQPLVLVLPVTGALRVRVEHPGRGIEPIAAGVHAGGDAYWSRRGTGGVVQFDRLPLRRTFALHVDVGEVELERTVAGPTVAGQVVDVTFQVPDDAIALTGRIVGDDGAAVASQVVQAVQKMSFGRRSFHVTTDAGGRFLMHTRAGGERTAEFEFQWWRWPRITLRGRVGPRELRPGTNDLGDIVLAPQPVLVAGRLEFAAGRSDELVALDVERCRGSHDGSAAWSWRREDDIDWIRQPDGRFVVHGAPPAGRLRLNLGDLVRPVEFERGTADLVVRVSRGHSLKLVCALPRGLETHNFRYALRTESGNGGVVREQYAGQWKGRAIIQQQALPAGSYVLEVFMHGVEGPVATERAIELPGPGGECDRLIDLDLAERMPVLRLRVAGPDGEVPEHIVAIVEQPGWRKGLPVTNGELVWPLRDSAADVTIVGAGCRDVVLRSVRGEVDVRLQPAPTVALRAAGLPRLPPGHTIEVSIDASHQGAPSVEFLTGPTPPLHVLRRETTWTRLVDGATWTVRASDVERRITALLRIGGDRVLPLRTVPDQLPPGTGSWTLAFDAAEVLAAMAAAKSDEQR